MKKKVKGFTLMEMIIVVALFGLIMAGALSLLQPLNRVYKDTMQYEGARATVDNIKMYIEDNVKYSRILHVYTGINNIEDISTIPEHSLISSTMASNNNLVAPYGAVDYLRNRYLLGDVGYQYSSSTLKRVTKAEDIVYLIHIDNPEYDSTGSIKYDLSNIDITNPDNRGKVTVYTYINGIEQTSERKVLSDVAYREYSFALNLGELEVDASNNPIKDAGNYKYTQFQPSKFAMTINIYANKRNPSLNQHYAEDTRITSVATFALVNIINSNGDVMQDDIKYEINGIESTTLKQSFKYASFKGNNATNDIYLVFTKAPKL